MKEETRLGKNIRALRESFGETQEELGFSLHLGKTTISSYENGTRIPDQQKLEMIAKHYAVSVEELLNIDLSFYEKIHFSVNPNIFFEKTELVLPIVSSEKAMKNDNFKTAYNLHKAMYDDFHNGKLESFDRIDQMFDGYTIAYGDENSKYQSAANYIALYFLLCMVMNVPENINDPSVIVNQVAAKDKRIKKLIDSIDLDFMEEFKKVKELFFDAETLETINEMKGELKHSQDYSDLADYYLALEYVYGYVDNKQRKGVNQMIGLEMISCFMSFGNQYAKNYLNYFIDLYFGSSQNVDDK